MLASLIETMFPTQSQISQPVISNVIFSIDTKFRRQNKYRCVIVSLRELLNWQNSLSSVMFYCVSNFEILCIVLTSNKHRRNRATLLLLL